MIIIFVTVLALPATIDASLTVNSNAKILQGPGSKATLIGPDGSSISTTISGGKVMVEDPENVVATSTLVEQATVVATEAPANISVNVTKTDIAETPTVISNVPVVSETLSAIKPLILTVQAAIRSPVLVTTGQTVVAGPSGIITASEPLSATNLLFNNLW